MNPDTVKSIQDALSPIAQKLGEGAQFTYETWYRQTIIGATTEITVASIILLLMFIICISVAVKVKPSVFHPTNYSWSTKKDIEAEKKLLARMTRTAVSIGIIILSYIPASVIIDGCMRLANPHYYTINTLIDSVKGAAK